MEMDPKDVERVARAILGVTSPDLAKNFERLHPDTQRHYRKEARAAISAMREGPASYRVRKLTAQPNRVSSRTVTIPRKPK